MIGVKLHMHLSYRYCYLCFFYCNYVVGLHQAQMHQQKVMNNRTHKSNTYIHITHCNHHRHHIVFNC